MNVIAVGTQGCSGAVVEYLLPNLKVEGSHPPSAQILFRYTAGVEFLWNSFYRKRLLQQNGDMRKRDLHAFKLHLEQGRVLSPLPRPPPPRTHL
jgi:hypothetical protein